jgi:hypothetical protein
MESMGDITASAEVSRLKVDGEEFDSRIQGGILVRDLLSADHISNDLSSTLRRLME